MIVFDDPLSEERWLTSDLSEIRKIETRLSEISASNGVTFLSLIDALCSKDQCLATVPSRDGNGLSLMAFDYGHVTYDGSLFISRELVAPKIKEIMSDPVE